MTEAVDAWMRAYANPQKPLVEAVRATILAADPRISEAIKWSAPTFQYKGNLASFNPRSKAHVSLVFHKGGLIAGEFPALEGDGPEARVMKITSPEDLAAKTAELQCVVRTWCDQRDRE